MEKKRLVKYSLTVFFLAIPLLISANIIKDDVLRVAGARAAGMGGAFTAISDDYSSYYWNPAGLVLSERISINVFFDSIFAGSQFNYGLNYTHPIFSDMTVAGTYLHTAFTESAFADDLLYLTYATYLNSDKNVSAGINLKFVNISMGDYGINGFSPGIDIGIMITPDFLEKKMKFGILIQDIDTVLSWSNNVMERVPAMYRLGASYSFDETAVVSLDLYGMDYMKTGRSGRYGFQAGAEKWFSHEAAGDFGFRAGVGWREARDPNARYTFGISYGREDFILDYVYIPGFNNLGETHKIDFSYMVGRKVKEKAVKKPEPEIAGGGLKAVAERFRDMKFNISSKYFSPNGDNVMDSVDFVLSGIPSLMRDIEWKLEIFDAQDNRVKEMSGREVMKKRITWDGMKDRKAAEKDGDYTVRYSVYYGGKLVWTKDRIVAIDTVPPRFKYYVEPKVFAPGRKSRIKEMKITVSPKDRDIKEWKLFIRDEKGNTVRRMSGEGFTEKMGWGGEDALGNTIKDGEYSTVLDLTDFAGNTNELTEKFTVDTYISKFNVMPSKRIFDIGSESISFNSNMRDTAKVADWDLEIRDFDGRLIRDFRNKSTGVKQVTWDGTDVNNKYARPGSIYRYRLIVSQRNGIETESEGIVQAKPPEFEGMGIELTLAAVDFADRSKEIPKDEFPYLNQAADAVKKYAKNYYLFIKAYATDYRDADRNLSLSIDRALAVKDYLVDAQKVPPEHIYVTGYGDGQYFDVSTKNEIEKSGRRVEIELMTK